MSGAGYGGAGGAVVFLEISGGGSGGNLGVRASFGCQGPRHRWSKTAQDRPTRTLL